MKLKLAHQRSSGGGAKLATASRQFCTMLMLGKKPVMRETPKKSGAPRQEPGGYLKGGC